MVCDSIVVTKGGLLHMKVRLRVDVIDTDELILYEGLAFLELRDG